MTNPVSRNDHESVKNITFAQKSPGFPRLYPRSGRIQGGTTTPSQAACTAAPGRPGTLQGQLLPPSGCPCAYLHPARKGHAAQCFSLDTSLTSPLSLLFKFSRIEGQTKASRSTERARDGTCWSQPPSLHTRALQKPQHTRDQKHHLCVYSDLQPKPPT